MRKINEKEREELNKEMFHAVELVRLIRRLMHEAGYTFTYSSDTLDADHYQMLEGYGLEFKNEAPYKLYTALGAITIAENISKQGDYATLLNKLLSINTVSITLLRAKSTTGNVEHGPYYNVSLFDEQTIYAPRPREKYICTKDAYDIYANAFNMSYGYDPIFKAKELAEGAIIRKKSCGVDFEITKIDTYNDVVIIDKVILANFKILCDDYDLVINDNNYAMY